MGLNCKPIGRLKSIHAKLDNSQGQKKTDNVRSQGKRKKSKKEDF
jgi:hypothetical protein